MTWFILPCPFSSLLYGSDFIGITSTEQKNRTKLFHQVDKI